VLSWLSLRRTVTVLTPARLVDSMWSTPLIADTTRSIGVVRKPRTVSALAPVYTVVMMTDEDSTSGNCCTGSCVSARTPTSTMIRLTTIAKTGCLMKTSVNARTELSL
jgi:hypothetical protein